MNGKITPEETEKVINVTPETTEMNINTTQENSTFLVLDDEAYTSQMIEEYNQNARAKTEEFNTNAENKIAIYNSNAADRATAFDNNYDNKIAAFNFNANKQTEEFDAHVLMQTNTFNNNATSAITNYNSNAAQKIDEFNQNASNFVNSLMVKKIEVVNELPETEEEGVLYLVKEAITPDEPVLEYVTNPIMEMGDISRSGVLSDSTSYCRTADYVYVYGKSSITITNGTGSNTRVLAYDENKTFMTDWNKDVDTSYSYRHVQDGSSMEIPTGAHYIKARFSSSEVKPLTITYND